MTPDNIVRVTSYLTDAAYAEANQNARGRPGPPPRGDHGGDCRHA